MPKKKLTKPSTRTNIKTLILAIEKLQEDKSFQQKLKLAEGFIATGNLAAGSLVFSQLLLEKLFDLRMAILGISLFTAFYAFAILILKEKKHVCSITTH